MLVLFDRLAQVARDAISYIHEFDSPPIRNGLLPPGAAALRGGGGVHHLYRYLRSEQQRYLRLPLQFEKREAESSWTGGRDAAPVLSRIASEQPLSLCSSRGERRRRERVQHRGQDREADPAEHGVIERSRAVLRACGPDGQECPGRQLWQRQRGGASHRSGRQAAGSLFVRSACWNGRGS